MSTDVEKFVIKWIKFYKQVDFWEKEGENSWISDACVFWPMERPEDTFLAIEEISKRKLERHEITMLGTGIVEALLAWHYDEYSTRIIKLAGKEKNLLLAMDCVNPPLDKETDYRQRLQELQNNKIELFFEGTLEKFCIMEDCISDNYRRSVVVEFYDMSRTKKTVHFHDVGHLNNLDFTTYGAVIISITDISDRGWENIKYSVEEICENRFSFYCNSYDIIRES